MKMYKIQKRTTRKRKESEKSTDKVRKMEGNINMSKRLSIPPEFLRTGVAASASYNSSSGKDCKERIDNYVVDNFHGLFDKCLNIRRSERLLKRSSNQNLNDTKSTIGGSSQDNINHSSDEIKHSGIGSLSKEAFDGLFNKPLKLNSYKKIAFLDSQIPKAFFPSNDLSKFKNREGNRGKHTLKRSKSIFNEINQLYTRSSQKKLLSSEEFDSSSIFCNSLFKQISRNFTFGPKTLLVCKSKIFSEIKKIENILSGKIKMDTKLSDKKREYYYETEENDENDLNFKYYPKSEWVYQTPPSQKIIPPKVDDNHLQPAVIYSTQKHTQIFEIKSNDLSNLKGRNGVDFNKNALNHLVTMNRSVDMDADNRGPCTSKSLVDNANSQNIILTGCDNAFNFTKPQDKDDLINVFSRPLKTFNDYRENPQAKRKLEEDLSQDMFANCKLSDLRKAKIVDNSTTPERRFDTNKKLFVSNFNLAQTVDINGSDFSFMDAHRSPGTYLGFDFTNIPKNSKNHSVFEFSINNEK